MKLNPDIIRDILKAVEEVTDDDTFFFYDKNDQVSQYLQKYSHKEIIYHLRQCSASGLIAGFQPYDGGASAHVTDLTPEGHKFLANVRQDNIWNNTKSIAAKVGTKSLDALIQISSNVITELIKAQFGLT